MRYGAGVILIPPPASRTEPLAQGVTGLAISYLTPQPSGPPAWSSSWTGSLPGSLLAKSLPLLIRIHTDFADGRNWPDLVAAPADFDSEQGKAPPS